ncbi:MAG: hypothetical protein EPO68_04810 [Planctomycetota bacterium]|nr:MAG: hypothetical protein EPO68_04810 [Planctomycetota bacterium]
MQRLPHAAAGARPGAARRRSDPRELPEIRRRRTRARRSLPGARPVSRTRQLEGRYARVLSAYVRLRSERALSEAYELGRRALADGVGLLELAATQQRCLVRLLGRARRGADALDVAAAAHEFFVESLSPFEITHRCARDVGAAARARNGAAPEDAADPLTPRERQVLELIGAGQSTKQVARTLGISLKTAQSHRTRLMAKLDIHEMASLVRYAIRRGIVRP